MFYNKELEIYATSEGYLDSKGVWVDGKEILYKTIMADVQPYSSERLYRSYGYNAKCTKRVFCYLDSGIKEGMKVKYEDEFYKINKIVAWDDYLDIFIDNWSS